MVLFVGMLMTKPLCRVSKSLFFFFFYVFHVISARSLSAMNSLGSPCNGGKTNDAMNSFIKYFLMKLKLKSTLCPCVQTDSL